MKWLPIKMNFLPLIFQEINNVTEEYITLLNKIRQKESKKEKSKQKVNPDNQNKEESPSRRTNKNQTQTESEYEIYPRKGAKLSLKKQFDVLDDIDRKYFLCLLDANADFRSFSKYLLKSETRSLASQIVGDEMTAPGTGIKK